MNGKILNNSLNSTINKVRLGNHAKIVVNKFGMVLGLKWFLRDIKI